MSPDPTAGKRELGTSQFIERGGVDGCVDKAVYPMVESSYTSMQETSKEMPFQKANGDSVRGHVSAVASEGKVQLQDVAVPPGAVQLQSPGVFLAAGWGNREDPKQWEFFFGQWPGGRRLDYRGESHQCQRAGLLQHLGIETFEQRQIGQEEEEEEEEVEANK